ncbi:MAG: alpha/beta fold hydrolase [Nocardioides sp.]
MERVETGWAPRVVLTGVLTLVVLLAGCTGDPPSAATVEPRFVETPCPEDVSTFLVQDHSCGTLEVARDRRHPDEGTVRLFVLRVEPPQGGSTAPMYVVGRDLGEAPDYAGIATQAQRIGRAVIMMDPRGTGHSEPGLACPEVRGLSRELVGLPTTDPQGRADFLDAVRACAGRLREEGVDVADFRLPDLAADAVDLRKALGVEHWGVTSHGTWSRLALEVVRRDAEAVDTLVLDSPEVPQLDPFSEAITGTRNGLARLSHECARQRACAAHFPHGLDAAAERALTRLRREPVRLTGRDGTSVTFDDVLMLRLLRTMLDGDQLAIELIPSLVHRVLAGTLDGLDEGLVEPLAVDQSYCIGYRPECNPLHMVSEGLVFSVLCGDLAGAVDRSRLMALAAGPTYADAFARSPYLDACDAWPGGRRSSEAARPLRADVPALLLVGGYDSFTSATAAHAALEGLPHGWVRLVGGLAGAHNLLGQECVRQVRNAWIAHPRTPPALATECREKGVPRLRLHPLPTDGGSR